VPQYPIAGNATAIQSEQISYGMPPPCFRTVYTVLSYCDYLARCYQTLLLLADTYPTEYKKRLLHPTTPVFSAGTIPCKSSNNFYSS